LAAPATSVTGLALLSGRPSGGRAVIPEILPEVYELRGCSLINSTSCRTNKKIIVLKRIYSSNLIALFCRRLIAGSSMNFLSYYAIRVKTWSLRAKVFEHVQETV
jgi:hypothetical protein